MSDIIQGEIVLSQRDVEYGDLFARSGAELAINAELSNLIKAQYDEQFGSLGIGFRKITDGEGCFELTAGGVVEKVPYNALTVVFIAMEPYDHARWYEKGFDNKQKDERTPPDLVWHMVKRDVYPEALPARFRDKVQLNQSEKWGFQIKRRALFARVNTNPDTGMYWIDLENPYILDIPSTSMYAESRASEGLFRWKDIPEFCRKYSTPGFNVYPNMFMIQLVKDYSSNKGVFYFTPKTIYDQAKQRYELPIFNAKLIAEIYAAATKPENKAMYTTVEKLTYTPKGEVMPVTAQQPPVQQPPVQQPPVQQAPVQQPPVQQPPVQQPPVQQPPVQQAPSAATMSEQLNDLFNSIQSGQNDAPVKVEQSDSIATIESLLAGINGIVK